MPAPYTPLALANRFIECFAQDKGIEHMKLQKLVYYSYGWWLQSYGLESVRITNEGPQVWTHGPVFASLYRVLKVFGREPILVPQSSNPFGTADVIDAHDVHVDSLVHWIWGRYGHLSSFALSDMTHRIGSSWRRVASEHQYEIAFNTQIPDQYILEEFLDIRNGDQQAARQSEEDASRRQSA